MKVSWIGTGVMGKSMAMHLMSAGHDMTVYNRTTNKTKELVDNGATLATTIKDAVSNSDVVFTMVGYPKDVQEVLYEIFEHAKKGTLVIDMTTSSPKLAKKLYLKGKDNGIRVMDAPVSGGDSGARNATLSIMVGGDKTDYDEVLPLFEIMGKTINYMGEAGNGQHTKMANQIAVAGATSAMCEAIAYAKTVGMEPGEVLEAISKGAAGSWQLTNMAPRVLNNDLNPGFYLKHFVKDMTLVKEESNERELTLDMLETILSMYEELVEDGYGDLGSQALIKYYELRDSNE